MNLAEFLLARIAEDDADTRGAMHMGCVEERDDPDDVIHGPRCVGRVVAECDAKRRIVEAAVHADEHADDNGDPYNHGEADALRDALRLLALPYANHPDYLPEWRP